MPHPTPTQVFFYEAFKKSGLSEAAFAEMIDISEKQLHRGFTDPTVSIDIIDKIAEGFSVEREVTIKKTIL